MISKRKGIYFIMVALFVTGLYFCFMGNRSSEEAALDNTVAPNNTIENLPPVDNAMPSKEDDNFTKVQEQLQVSSTPSEIVKIERAPSLPPDHGESVNLQEQSYSIKNEKKDIPITPGISLQRGKSINVKIPGEEEIIRVQRDKIYHPGGYNVLWEKKY